MFRKMILPASLGLAALTALVPNAASAQSYGGWSGQSYSNYGYRGDDRYRDYSDRSSYRDRQRWIAHRRWEQEQRRREWQREQWRRHHERDGWYGDRYDYRRR